jgi:hypothetical protein
MVERGFFFFFVCLMLEAFFFIFYLVSLSTVFLPSLLHVPLIRHARVSLFYVVKDTTLCQPGAIFFSFTLRFFFFFVTPNIFLFIALLTHTLSICKNQHEKRQAQGAAVRKR